MKSELMKRIIVLFLVFVVPFSLIGCDSRSNLNSHGSVEMKELNNLVYNTEEIVLPDVQGKINRVFVQDDSLYIFASEWVESGNDDKSDNLNDIDNSDTAEDDGFTVLHMYCMKLDGTGIDEIPLPMLGTHVQMEQICVNDDETYTYLLQDEESFAYFLVKTDKKGNEIARENMTNKLGMNKDENISNFIMDNNENYIFVFDRGVACFDKDMNPVYQLEAERNTQLHSLAEMKDGRIVVGNFSPNDRGFKFIDVAGKQWGEKVSVNTLNMDNDSLMNGCGEYDFFYKDSLGIYGYVESEHSMVKVMDYLSSNIDSTNICEVTVLSDNVFVLHLWENGEYKILLCKETDESQIENKTIIQLAMIQYSQDIKNEVLEFNKSNSQYQIEIRDYSGSTDPMAKFDADLVAGKGADIIVLDNLPIEKYESKGCLTDLIPYFNKDEDLCTDDLVSSLLNAMMCDDKLYYITPDFFVATMVAASETVGTEMGWTVADCKKVIDEKDENTRLFYDQGKEAILAMLSGSATVDFVDWKTGKCSYDTEEFKQLLEICNLGTNEKNHVMESSESSAEQLSLMRNGNILFKTVVITHENVQLCRKMYDREITYIGYPNKEKEGSYFLVTNAMGINSQSEQKDAAWNFIRTFITKEYQHKNVSILPGEPSRKDALEYKNKIASITEAETFTDEYGHTNYPVSTRYGFGDVFIDIEPATPEDVDTYMKVIDNTKKVGMVNNDIYNIICEECASYFSGDKSVDEVANIIQNRVKTYVDEQR